MENPAVSAKQLVDLARKHIEEQQRRIVSQHEQPAEPFDRSKPRKQAPARYDAGTIV
jgi:hypothetical protein